MWRARIYDLMVRTQLRVSNHGDMMNRQIRPGGHVKVETVKPTKAPADSGSLHKKMMQLLSSLWVTHAIGTFARLGLADAMEAGAEDAETIAKAARPSPIASIACCVRSTTCGIVTESAGGKFALTPLGRLLTSNAPNSMRTSAELLTEYNGEIWSRLDGALEGGIAFEALKGKPLFDWLHANPEEGARFQRMMVEVHSPEDAGHVAAYDFSQFRHIVDVGGGHGMLLSAIIAAHPTCAARCSTAGRRRCGQARRRRPAAGRDVHRRRRVRDRAGGGRRLFVPASAARLRRRRLHQDAQKRPQRHEAGFARAGAGEDGADRRHAGSRPLA